MDSSHVLDRLIRHGTEHGRKFLTPTFDMPAINAQNVFDWIWKEMPKGADLIVPSPSGGVVVRPPWKRSILFWKDPYQNCAVMLFEVISEGDPSLDTRERTYAGIYMGIYAETIDNETRATSAFMFALNKDGGLATYMLPRHFDEQQADMFERGFVTMNEDVFYREVEETEEAQHRKEVVARRRYLNHDAVNAAAVVGLSVVLQAGAIANCKGSTTYERSNSTELHKQWRREGAPVYKYKTLVIGSMADSVRVITDSPGDGRGMPLHIVRGHIKHYSEERRLFGKYAGNFWVPQHTAGSADLGVVEKGYNIRE